MNPNDIYIETKRLIIRALQIDDANEIYKNINNEQVSRWTANVPHPYTLENAHDFIEYSNIAIENDKKLDLGIILKETGKLIGCAGFVDLDLKNNNAEIGYWLGEKYWGKGIMSEAVFAIIKYGFDNLKLHKIYGKHISENINSKRIFEKLGFKEEGLLREQVLKKGKYFDKKYWGLLKDDFNDIYDQ